MVTLIKYGVLSGGEKYNVNVLSLDGLSTDAKPTRAFIEYGSDGREVGRTGIPNGSLYTEIDTGDTYMYDADNMTWYQVESGGGGGGGFTPTTAQLAAMNSGINSTKVAQIATNENNILLKADKTTTDSLQNQIDQIAQAAGTGSADTEVAQARVGANGTEYSTLKQRLDSDFELLSSDITGISDWLGFSQNLCNCNDFVITNTSNWAISTTRDSITVTHKTSYSTGYPSLTFSLPAGTYVFNADFSESSVKRFGLYLNGSYDSVLLDGGTITLLEAKTVTLTFSPSSAGTFIVTGISLTNTAPSGIYQEIEGQISSIDATLSEINFAYVYKQKELDIKTGTFILSNGSESTTQATFYCSCDYVAINTSKVRVTASANYGNNFYAFYDNNKVFISGEVTESTGATIDKITDKEVDVPANAAYIRIAWIDSARGNVGLLETLSPAIIPDTLLSQTSLDNKKWCVIGDSLTEKNNQAPTKYYDYLAFSTTTFAYLGKSGTGFLQTYNTYENYVDRVDALTGEEGYDVISVMGGINDSGHIGTDYQLGQLGDTEPTTIYGAIYYVFNSLITKFPLAFVFAITEPVTSYRHDLGNNIDAIQQAVREVCDWLKIPVADANAKSGMRPWIEDFAAEYYVDNTHPNSKGHEKIAKSIVDIFKTI